VRVTAMNTLRAHSRRLVQKANKSGALHRRGKRGGRGRHGGRGRFRYHAAGIELKAHVYAERKNDEKVDSDLQDALKRLGAREKAVLLRGLNERGLQSISITFNVRGKRERLYTSHDSKQPALKELNIRSVPTREQLDLDLEDYMSMNAIGAAH